MDTRIIHDDSELEQLKEAWQHLEMSDPDAHVYNSFVYTQAWLKSRRGDESVRPFVVLALQGERILGIAPLFLKKRSRSFLQWNELQFLNQGDYHNLLIDRTSSTRPDTIIKALMQRVEAENEAWDRLLFNYLVPSSEFGSWLFRSDDYNPHFHPLVEIPLLTFQLFTDEKEMERQFPSKVRKHAARLQKDVGYTFRIVSDIDEALYERIASIHKTEQQYLREHADRSERYSLFEDDRRDTYLKELLASDETQTVLYLIETGAGEIICYRFAFMYRNRIYSWNSAYNIKYKDYRSSAVLYYEMFRYLYENRNDFVFDFGAGRYPWKFGWANGFESAYQLDVWKPRGRQQRLVERLMRLR